MVLKWCSQKVAPPKKNIDSWKLKSGHTWQKYFPAIVVSPKSPVVLRFFHDISPVTPASLRASCDHLKSRALHRSAAETKKPQGWTVKTSSVKTWECALSIYGLSMFKNVWDRLSLGCYITFALHSTSYTLCVYRCEGCRPRTSPRQYFWNQHH